MIGLQQLNMSELDCSAKERLKQLLKILDTFCTDSSAAEMQQFGQLANEAKRVVNKMQNILESSLVEQVAELVQAMKWDEVNEKIMENFPNGLSIGKVKEILELVYLNSRVKHQVSAIRWVGQLDVQLQPKAYKTLYEQFKFNEVANQPQVLFLRHRVSELPEGRVSNSFRAQLHEDFQTIVDQIVEGVKKEDYSLQQKINGLENMPEKVKELIMNEVVPVVVDKFETLFTLENTLLLIQYSEKLPFFVNSCFLINALMKMLEARKMLSSEQGSQLWSHAKYTMEEQPNWKNVPKATQKLCTDIVDKLNMHKLQFFQHYLKYVEDQDMQKIHKVHEKNWHLLSILSEFVTWYYKKDDSTTVQNILSAARATHNFRATQCILTQLQIEMQKFQQMNTFEAFRLYNEVKDYIEYIDLVNVQSYEPEFEEAFEELRAKIPTCLRLLLWSDLGRGKKLKLQLVNKFFNTPLRFQQDRFVCSDSSSDKEIFFTTYVDANTALTTFCFVADGIEICVLTIHALENTTAESWIESVWKVKAVDDTHVKIFTDDGE